MQTRNVSRSVNVVAAAIALVSVSALAFHQTTKAAGNFKLDGQGRLVSYASPATRSAKLQQQTVAQARRRSDIAILVAIRDFMATEKRQAAINDRIVAVLRQAQAQKVAGEGRLGRPAQAAARQPTRPKPPAPPIALGDWRAQVAKYQWDVGTALRIVWCESRNNPSAHNRSGANGLFQILGGPSNPTANVAQAYEMYRGRGWQPWNSSRNCWS